MKVKLTSRQQRVLWATIQRYVATAEPVGSKILVKEYDFGVSPATVRSTMSGLEKSGLLYQPHASAGRVPSDSGYRVYVNELIAPPKALLRELSRYVAEHLSAGGKPLSDLNLYGGDLELLLRGAAQLLAAVSGCIALITVPQAHTVAIRHLQLVLVSAQRVMVVAVLDSYQTRSVVMDLPTVLEAEAQADTDALERELQILSNFLNAQLRGRRLSELAALDWADLNQEFYRYAEFLRRMLTLLALQASSSSAGHILISGVSEVLRQPEFSERQQVQDLIQILEEEREQLWPLICEWSEAAPDSPDPDASADAVDSRSKAQRTPNGSGRVSVRIGSENPLEPLHHCSLISSAYRLGGIPVGSVGILGPTRLPYERAIASVQVTADHLANAIQPSA